MSRVKVAWTDFSGEGVASSYLVNDGHFASTAVRLSYAKHIAIFEDEFIIPS